MLEAARIRSMNQTDLSQYSPLLFILVGVGIWLAVTIHFSYTSGWALLAKVYKLSKPFRGERWSFQSGKMSSNTSLDSTRLLGAMRSALTIGANQNGLYLSTFFLFRLTNPPLFIPWDDVSVSLEKGFISNYMKFQFRRAPSVTLQVSEWVGRQAIKHSQSLSA